jgi:hypothetical protein
MPVGRYFMFEISPIGSGSATICSSPSAMVAIALSDSVRRSSSASAKPFVFAASRSFRFAARNASASRRIAAAINASARFFAPVSAFAIARDALRARWPTSFM